VPPRRAPRLGEHGAPILKELGFSDSEVSHLQDSGAVASFNE
jgi:formyl-CoA transferase